MSPRPGPKTHLSRSVQDSFHPIQERSPMRIPTVGDPVLFTIAKASPQDNRPAERRPARITRVWNYKPTGATVNLIVDLDGPHDLAIVGKSAQVEGFQMFRSSAVYDPNSGEGTWCYAEDLSEDIEERVEEIIITLDITHGREIIRAGAVGIWDSARNLISFDRADVAGLHADISPQYPANKFIDQHLARMKMPSGFFTTIIAVPSDGSESPDERQFLVGDMMRLMQDPDYRDERRSGRPAPMAGSIRRAIDELQRAEGRTPQPRDRRQSLTVDENTGGDGKQGNANEARQLEGSNA